MNQKTIRIKLAVYACAYEFYNTSFIDDIAFDRLALQVNVDLPTDNKKLDKWFKREYSPYTGQWIHKHPGLPRLRSIVEGILKND